MKSKRGEGGGKKRSGEISGGGGDVRAERRGAGADEWRGGEGPAYLTFSRACTNRMMQMTGSHEE